METESLIQEFPDKADRRNHILKNQLYGISPDQMCQLMSTRTVYGTIGCKSNIISFGENYLRVMQNTDKRFLYNRLKEEFNKMNFDVVIGNPPYNKGMDLDFVDLGYKISDKYVCMITPAKWQTAEASQKVSSKTINYGQFRELYVPHMSYVCFYPDCLDVFCIQETSGITYYLMDKDIHENKCTVKNSSQRQHKIDSTVIRDITHQQSLWNIGDEIVSSIGKHNRFVLETVLEYKRFTINVNKQMNVSTGTSGVWDWDRSCIKPDCIGRGGVLFNQNGALNVTGKPKLLINGNTDKKSGTSVDIFTTDDPEECKAFYSYIETKLVKFLILINLSSLTIINNNTFRFVPEPEAFDHVFTNEELYKKYNLTDNEIDIIESVIKERK